MKRFCCLFFLFFCCSLSFATKMALVIGIGDYPASGGWAKINGDKDVPVVRQLLLNNGFKAADIKTLVNEQATCSAIKNSFAQLISTAKSGDIIYIHFSGHGQQITDIHGDEEDGYDEAWIPYDAALEYKKGKYEGKNHIIDDQLNRWLTQLRQKVGDSGKITVVADACHSGGGSRCLEDDEECSDLQRGSMAQFVISGVSVQYKPSAALKVDWVFVSACNSVQTNYEYQGGGRLTYALNQYSNRLQTMTCDELMKGIKSTMKKIERFTQTPTIDATATGKSQPIF